MVEQHNQVLYLQFDHYRQFPELISAVFTRVGGYSETPFASLNTAKSVGDTVEHVVQNRQAIVQALGIGEFPTVTLWQIHSAEVLTVDLQDAWRTDWAQHSYFEPPWTPETIRKGDALISQERAATLMLSFADCVPITFYDPQKQVIGIAHGGWRGTARGVVMATVDEMQQRFACQPEDIYAGIGPSIRACCYEVSEEVRTIFMGRQEFDTMPTLPAYRKRVKESAVFSTIQLADKESLRIDLQETHRNQLLAAGLHPEHIEIMPICTSCNTDLFFSHRKEQGKTGRFVVAMALKQA
ncbi:MAG TPA: peptidoglycan editing factor PgeF [Dictyobacter sp.]|nr:peptidoglycan editing factor PgeF [Dictyobacter sp.]